MKKKNAKSTKATKDKKRTLYPKVKKQTTAKETNVKPAKPIEVKIFAAKGRPMLQWIGKKPLGVMNAFPAQLIETFDPLGLSFPNVSIGNPEKVNTSDLDSRLRGNDKAMWSDWPTNYPKGGLLFLGDNKEVLTHLLANGMRGKVKLIYIDPPFDSGADYVRRVQLRGSEANAKIDGESYNLGEQVQYTDIWANDNYLQFIYERLILLKEFLSVDGNIYLHTDWHKGHHLRCLMDEVFGSDSFKNEIVWRYSKYQMRGMSRFVNNHDVLYWYSKGDNHTYNLQTEKLDEPKLLKRKKWDKDSGKIVNVRDEEGKLIYDSYEEGKIDDVWDIDIIGATSGERSDYPTQKPETLLERVIRSSSNPTDIILDCFIGSGTIAVVAQKLGRRWIGCDINKGAIQTTSKRLQTIIQEQIEEAKKKSQQGALELKNVSTALSVPPPAQLSFSIYRVNDYDLQIQHNEAVNIACEHIGVTRTKNDSFFDGTRGKGLVKIAPFNHPLSPVDLEEIKKELKARPNEDRDVLVVCLGKELAVDTWLADWNRLRSRGDVPNKIDIIELRTDQKYGKFIKHEPAKARVKVQRKREKIEIEIVDFISPTIIERLSQQNGLLQPKIEDWRSMVDCVMIDPNYNGKVFNISLSDVPEKKNDLVSGKYELPAPSKKVKVAVKIIDMLGEEVVEVREV